MFSALDYNLSGIYLEPSITSNKDFRKEFVKFLVKPENDDIISGIPDDILVLCDLRLIKHDDSIIRLNDNKLFISLIKFINENNIIVGRFPAFILRYINCKYNDIVSSPTFSDILNDPKYNVVSTFSDVLKNPIPVKKLEYISKDKEAITHSKKGANNGSQNYSENYPDSNCIMLRNIGFETTKTEIIRFLGNHGVKPCKMEKGINFAIINGKKKNYCFVTFDSTAKTNNAKKILEGKKFKNYPLKILNAKGKDNF